MDDSLLMAAIIVLGVAALGGAWLAWRRWFERSVPLGVSSLHGLLGMAGLVIVVIIAARGKTAGVGLFTTLWPLLTAMIGVYLGARHLQERPRRVSVILVHLVFAVVGWMLLVSALYIPE